MDEVRKQHNGIKKLYEQGLRGATASVEQVLNLFDTIEALQAENEQLQAQVARMREALRKARKALHKGISELKVHCKYFDQTPEEDACIEMHEAVVEIDKGIGGKEDA